jgi:competence protein ComEA
MEPKAGTEPTADAGDAAAAAPTTVVVHVAGRVHRPGIVELPAGARVAEAIEAAGGATDEADTTRVNLARVLVDGEQVLVLAPDEDPPPGTGAPPVAAAPPVGGAAPGAGAGAEAGAGAGAGSPAAVVDLNTATLADLETLPGIGPVLGQRILDWRTANGRFSSVDELREISGLGEKRIADLQDKVRV